MRKQTVTVVLCLTLLITALAGTLLVRDGIANPFVPIPGRPTLSAPPPPEPAVINLTAPQNNASYTRNIRINIVITNQSDKYSVYHYLDGQEITEPIKGVSSHCF